MQLRCIPYLILICSKMLFPYVAASHCVFPRVVIFFVPRVSWLVSPLVGNRTLVIAIILSIFAFARWWKLMLKWRSSMISWDTLSLPSKINFGEALLLNELIAF